MAPYDPFHDITIGYPKLAARTEVQPELAIYRRFGAMNAQNLLYYQAELVDLEVKLRAQQVRDDKDRKGQKTKYAKTWFRLEDSEDDDALIQQSIILNLPKPARWDLHWLQKYLQSKEMGELALLGEDAEVWGSMEEPHGYKPDLVALKPRVNEDPFSAWAARNTIVGLERCGLDRFLRPSPVHGVVGYEDTTIYSITYCMNSILASLIPIASIVVLCFVSSMPARLGTIAGFNVLVSICLMAFAGAKRAEVFAISAAFAAVQVVFVGTDQSSSSST
ncbi:hypothetical protein Ptr902_03331 [Pyrenophora tritici-repentis]|nr:hypothetical protein A1F99_064620 [Pyrenophora tritici-repentis]KAI2484391.1 hypothetical protein Ptr902_03331 [Pyrenophora tritici-repentis]